MSPEKKERKKERISLKSFSRNLGQEIHRMQEKRTFSGKKRQQAVVCLPACIWSKNFADTMGDLQLEALFQEPGTQNSQDAGKVSLSQGSIDSKLQCVLRPIFEARSSLIQWETSSSAQITKVQLRGLWNSCFLWNPWADIPRWEQYSQWGRKSRECVWHGWVHSWDQLFKGVFPLEVGPKSH